MKASAAAVYVMVSVPCEITIPCDFLLSFPMVSVSSGMRVFPSIIFLFHDTEYGDIHDSIAVVPVTSLFMKPGEKLQ